MAIWNGINSLNLIQRNVQSKHAAKLTNTSEARLRHTIKERIPTHEVENFEDNNIKFRLHHRR